MDSTGNDALPLILNADLAMLLCARVWGLATPRSPENTAWQRLDPAWQDRLKHLAGTDELVDPTLALSLLQQSHRQQARAEPGRVHSSWCLRALQEESPAVRRAVAAYGPLSIRSAATSACGLRPDELEAGPAPHPQVLEWALALWTERLVGGEPPQPAEPPAIFALASLSPPLLYRLCHALGVARTSLAGDPEAILAPQPAWAVQRAWLQNWFLDQFGSAEPKLRAWAGNDLAIPRAEKGLVPRRKLAVRGLTSIARLLTEPESCRVRWALQHVPYPIVKRIRSIMAMQTNLTASHLQMESILLRAAWEWLAQERDDMPRHLAYSSRKAEVGDVA